MKFIKQIVADYFAPCYRYGWTVLFWAVVLIGATIMTIWEMQ